METKTYGGLLDKRRRSRDDRRMTLLKAASLLILAWLLIGITVVLVALR